MGARVMRVLFVWVCAVGSPLPSLAQGSQTGILRGVVTDPQDRPISGASITIDSPSLQGQRRAASDMDGTYVFRTLPPGDYRVTVGAPSFADVLRLVAVPLGGTAEENVTLDIGTVEEQVTVTASVPPPLSSAVVGLNVTHEQVDRLAASRTLQGIATLSPGVSELTPNAGQLTINGAFAFDNVFMLNGVDVDDNLLGAPQDLFIEDAIAETQVLTSGISAEYGRFSGGVVNAITRSGGNALSGSYRLNLSNPAWVGETPFETANGIQHESLLNATHEVTIGGPIRRDRLWMFGASRLARQSLVQTLRETGIPVTQSDRGFRGEAKATATLGQAQTVQVGYLDNARSVTNTSGLFSLAADPDVLVTRSTPNWYSFANYRGVLASRHLAEVQYSERRFQFQGAGTSTAIVDSPFYSPAVDVIYNAPYFDASDQDHKNNRQLTGNLVSFFDRRGHHETKLGYEFFRSQRTGGGSQSATDYVFDADYLTDVEGAPLLDANRRPIPLFVPGETVLEHYIAIRGATLSVDNHSLFAQDHWTVNRHVSADLGVRFEHVRSEATGHVAGVDTATLVPRLAVAFDPGADGRWTFHATYAHYSGRYNEAQIGGNSSVGNADYTLGTYVGPAGQGRTFAPGLNVANYVTDFGSFPAANVSIADDLTSPLTRETTFVAGRSTSSAFGEVAYVWRRTSNVIDNFIDRSNGTTAVSRDGFDAGTFTNVVWANSDVGKRRYQAVVFRGRAGGTSLLTLEGNWTIQLQNDGNYEGEATNQPGAPSPIGDYPEAFSAERQYPDGRLNGFQRHRARVWATVARDVRRFGSVTVSALTRIESGQAYSLRATNQSLTATQRALLSGYPDRPANQVVYFGPRGSERFRGYAVVDLSSTWTPRLQSRWHPYAKVDLFNVLNNDTQIAWNTTVRQDPASPRDGLGLATGYVKAASFGAATSNAQFPLSPAGTGLRGLRIAIGVRF
jgi:hypothetical protein